MTSWPKILQTKISTTHQQSEICVKFSVFHTVLVWNFGEILRFGHPNPGKRSTQKISCQIARHLWQRKTEKKFTPHFCSVSALKKKFIRFFWKQLILQLLQKHSSLARRRSQTYNTNNCFRELFYNNFGHDGKHIYIHICIYIYHAIVVLRLELAVVRKPHPTYLCVHSKPACKKQKEAWLAGFPGHLRKDGANMFVFMFVSFKGN